MTHRFLCTANAGILICVFFLQKFEENFSSSFITFWTSHQLNTRFWIIKFNAIHYIQKMSWLQLRTDTQLCEFTAGNILSLIREFWSDITKSRLLCTLHVERTLSVIGYDVHYLQHLMQFACNFIRLIRLLAQLIIQLERSVFYFCLGFILHFLETKCLLL